MAEIRVFVSPQCFSGAFVDGLPRPNYNEFGMERILNAISMRQSS